MKKVMISIKIIKNKKVIKIKIKRKKNLNL